MKKDELQKFREKRKLYSLREKKSGNKKWKKLLIIFIVLSLAISGIAYYIYSSKDKRVSLADLKSNSNIKTILGDNATLLRAEIVKKGLIFTSEEAYFDVAYLDTTKAPTQKQVEETGDKLFNEVKKQYPIKDLFFYTYDKKDAKLQYDERYDDFKFEFRVSKKDKSDAVNKTIANLYSDSKVNFFKDVEKDKNILSYKYLSLREYSVLDAKFTSKKNVNVKINCQLKDGLAYDRDILYFLQQYAYEVKKENTPKVEQVNIISENAVSVDAYGKKIESYVAYSTNYPTNFKFVQSINNEETTK